MSDTVQVVRRRNGRESVVFEGLDKDALKFVSDNYPRVHAEPGSPDTPVADALLKVDGEYFAWHGPETGLVATDENGTPTDDDAEPDDDNDDTETSSAKKTAAKKTAAKKTSAPASFGGSK